MNQLGLLGGGVLNGDDIILEVLFNEDQGQQIKEPPSYQ